MNKTFDLSALKNFGLPVGVTFNAFDLLVGMHVGWHGRQSVSTAETSKTVRSYRMKKRVPIAYSVLFDWIYINIPGLYQHMLVM